MAIISDGSSVDGRSFSHGFSLRNCAQWQYSISIDATAPGSLLVALFCSDFSVDVLNQQ